MNKKTIIIGAFSTLLITGGVAGTAVVLINGANINSNNDNRDVENKNIIFNKANIQNLIKSIQQQINENKLTRTEFSKDNFKDIVINNLYSIDKKVGHLIEDVKLINSKQIQIFLNKKNDYQLDGIIAADNLAEYDKSTKIITLNISSLSFYELYDVSNLENLYQQLNDWIIDPTRLYTLNEFLNFVETNNELIKTIILQYLNFNIVNKISNNDLIRIVIFNQNNNQLEITLNDDYKKYNLTESNNIKIIDNVINVYNFTFYTSHTITNNKLNNLESEIQSYINSENNMFTINEFNQQIDTNILKSEIANFLGINVSAIGQITFNNNILKIYPITMNKFVTESNNIIEKVEVNNLRFYVSKSLFNLEELYNAINSYIINTNRKFSIKDFNNYLINSKIEAKQLIADNLYISETQTMDFSDINDLVFDETNKILKIVLNNNYIKYNLVSTTNVSVRNNVISVSNLKFYTPLTTTDQNIHSLKQNIQNYINLVTNRFSLEEFNQQLNSINFKREIANYLSIDINGIGEILFSNGILKIKASNFFKFVSDSITGSNNIIDGISIDGLQFYTIHELTNLENLYNVLNNYILEPFRKYTSVEFEDEVQQNNIVIRDLIANNLYVSQNEKIDPNDVLDIKFNEMLKQLEITLANNYVKYNFIPTNHATIENNKLIIGGFTFYEKIMIDEIRLNNFKSNVQDYINELANQYTLNEFTSQINSSGFKNLIASSLGVTLATINEIKYENDVLTIVPNNMKKFVSNSTSNILNDGELKVTGLQFYIQENLVKLDMLYKAVNDYILNSSRKYTATEFSNITNTIDNQSIKELIGNNLYINENQTIGMDKIQNVSFDEQNNSLEISLNTNYKKYNLVSYDNVIWENNKLIIKNLNFYNDLSVSDENLKELYNAVNDFVYQNSVSYSNDGNINNYLNSEILKLFKNVETISGLKLEHFINTINNSNQSITISLKNGLYKYQDKSLDDNNIVVTNNSITLNNLFIASPDNYFNFSSDGTTITSLTNLGSTQSTFVIPKKILTLSERLFNNNLNIQYIDMRFSNITVLSTDRSNSTANGMFGMCKNLKEVKLPLKLTNIGCNAFSYCLSLTKIDFPSKLTEINNFAFCHIALEEVFIPKNIKKLGYDFQDITYCTKVIFEEGCTVTIQQNSFTNSKILETVIIPDSITFIDYSAFKNSPNAKFYVSSETMKNKLLSWNIQNITEDRIIVQNN